MTRALGDLTYAQLREAFSAEPHPVTLLVLGAIEAHGPHLPLDTDTVIGLHVAREAARRLEDEEGLPTLMAPAFSTTAASCAAAFPGTVDVPRDVECALLVSVLRSLVRAGARRIGVLTLHFDPEHRGAIKGALANLTGPERAAVTFVDFTRREHVAAIGGEFATGDCHGGQFETSLMLAAAPERVDSAFKDLPGNEVGLVAAIRGGNAAFGEIGMVDAYCGRPADASAEDGHALTRDIAGIVVGALAGRAEQEVPGGARDGNPAE